MKTTNRPTREERTAQALATLEAGIDAITSTDAYADYLRTLARFHTYSWGNALMILQQRPDASRVAGYEAWKTFGRQVRKGEQGIRILVPHVAKHTNDAGDEERTVRGFGVGYVFDITQTEGDELPSGPQPQDLTGSSVIADTVYSAAITYLEREGLTFRRQNTKPAHGFYNPRLRLVAVDEDLATDQATKTLVHELAHYAADHRKSQNVTDVETVAESVAFVVLDHFGLDTSGYSFAYVAHWGANREVLKRNLSTIQKTAHALIDAFTPGPDAA